MPYYSLINPYDVNPRSRENIILLLFSLFLYPVRNKSLRGYSTKTLRFFQLRNKNEIRPCNLYPEEIHLSW
jgi:hypothetical protein